MVCGKCCRTAHYRIPRSPPSGIPINLPAESRFSLVVGWSWCKCFLGSLEERFNSTFILISLLEFQAHSKFETLKSIFYLRRSGFCLLIWCCIAVLSFFWPQLYVYMPYGFDDLSQSCCLRYKAGKSTNLDRSLSASLFFAGTLLWQGSKSQKAGLSW